MFKKFKNIAKLIFLLYPLFSLASINGNNNDSLFMLKERYKHDNISTIPAAIIGNNGPVALYGDRLEADAILELLKGYRQYNTYRTYVDLNLPKVDEVVLIMPRIDLLEQNITKLSELSKNVLVFIMDGDRLVDNEIYGDRSYESYLLSGLFRKLPSNVKVFRLSNDSVTSTGSVNNFEISNILTSRVFLDQILSIYEKESTLKLISTLIKK